MILHVVYCIVMCVVGCGRQVETEWLFSSLSFFFQVALCFSIGVSRENRGGSGVD